jgi:arylsulfatase A-like enzyme
MPLAMMWKRGLHAAGRTVTDHVSFIDFAPTFLELAGAPAGKLGMQPVEGRSLLSVIRSDRAGQVDPARDHVLIGKERNDVGRPHDQGYPIRGIVKDGWLYLHNFEPERWPAGNPETGYLDTDGSPTKTACIESRRDPRTKKYWDLCFGKRPREELYHIADDPDCINNLSADPKSRPMLDQLRSQLFAALKKQADPRILGNGKVFDEYPNASAERGFYERFKRGETLRPGWVNQSDFEKEPLD